MLLSRLFCDKRCAHLAVVLHPDSPSHFGRLYRWASLLTQRACRGLALQRAVRQLAYLVLSLMVTSSWSLSPALGQSASATNSRRVFEEDLRSIQRTQANRKSSILTTDQPLSSDTHVEAPDLDFDRDTNEVIARGGVRVAHEGVQVQAERARVNLETQDSELWGGVEIASKDGNLAADSAIFNLEDQIGLLNKFRFLARSGEYSLFADKALKLSDTRYDMTEFACTGCNCPDGVVPWLISGDDAKITYEGYAHIYDARLSIYDVPVLRLPYFGFPVKTERASGLLPPQWLGYNNQDGFRYQQPFFLVVDDSADLMISPFIASRSRWGSSFQARKAFSANHSLRTRWWYSDESWRQGQSRGLVLPTPEALDVPDVRQGGFFYQQWRSDRDWLMPLEFLADVHYVGDDNFVREIVDDDIALRSSTFTSSIVSLRSTIGESLVAETRGEFTQILDNDNQASDDSVFQRMPQFSLDGLRSFRPFGTNPLGLKMVLSGGAALTNFTRDVGYEGTRAYYYPTVAFPFHIKNYLTSELKVRSLVTQYSVSNTLPEDNIDSSPRRDLYTAQYQVASELERVFDVEPDGFLQRVLSLGASNQDTRVTRLKSTIEPFSAFTYTPDQNQDRQPFFDSVDRVRERRIVTYGVTSSLYGRALPRPLSLARIPELAPSPDEVQQLGILDTLPEFGRFGAANVDASARGGRVGGVAELASITMLQAYDFVEEEKDLDPNREPLSDLRSILTLTPTSYVRLSFDTNTNVEKANLSSWSSAIQVRDDRNDIFSLAYDFIDVKSQPDLPPPPDVNQVTASGEAVLTDRLKLGVYHRYDLAESQLIEGAYVLRILSACNCWRFDVGFSERINPDREQITLRFTFSGLGDITQDVFSRTAQQQIQN